MSPSQNKESPVVSVIMAIYNAGVYFEESVQSVLNQTYPHFELILVDDGSTDGTLEAAQKFAKKEARIRLFQVPSLGPGGARNKGLDEALGTYITLTDHDDVAHPQWLEKLVTCMEKEGTTRDMVICNAVEFAIHQSTFVGSHLCFSKKVTAPNISKKELFLAINPAPWIKLVRRSFLFSHKIRFAQDGILLDDCLFFFWIIWYIKEEHIGLVQEELFYHRRFPTSITGTGGKVWFDHIRQMRIIEAQAIERNEDVGKALEIYFPLAFRYLFHYPDPKAYLQALKEIVTPYGICQKELKKGKSRCFLRIRINRRELSLRFKGRFIFCYRFFPENMFGIANWRGVPMPHLKKFIRLR